MTHPLNTLWQAFTVYYRMRCTAYTRVWGLSLTVLALKPCFGLASWRFPHLSLDTRWLELDGRSTDDVLIELLDCLDAPQHIGGCGDSGRLDKESLSALKRYVPRLQLYGGSDASSDARISSTLEWVKAAAVDWKTSVGGDGSSVGEQDQTTGGSSSSSKNSGHSPHLAAGDDAGG